ncbi:hypothetical protein BDK51DRAFT_45529, partial [Blyttiomyces helicus]
MAFESLPSRTAALAKDSPTTTAAFTRPSFLRDGSSPSPPQKISYKAFSALAPTLPARFHPYLSPAIFLRFPRDANDPASCISTLPFFNFVLRKVSLLTARVELAEFDGDHDGALTEEELEDYIRALLPSLHLRNVTPAFHKYYLCTAVRKFTFFLDPMRRGKLPILTILLSPILNELLELREPLCYHDYKSRPSPRHATTPSTRKP